MLNRGRPNHSSDTLKKFDEFMRKRTQKNTILQSENQPIDRKINCFEELIRLTKTGATISRKPHQEVSQPTKCKSSKNILEKGGQSTQSLAELEQNTEAIFGKLDRMVNDVNGWDISRKNSKYLQGHQHEVKRHYHKQSNLTTTHNAKFKKFIHSSAKMSRIARTNNPNDFTNCETMPAEQKNHYLPMRKTNINRISRQMEHKRKMLSHNKTTSAININSSNRDFDKLKQQISQLQNKAKLCYGLNFNGYKPNRQIEENQADSQIDSFQQNRQLLKATSNSQLNKIGCYQKLVKTHIQQDSSVPANLLGMVRASSSRGYRSHVQQCWASRYIRV